MKSEEPSLSVEQVRVLNTVADLQLGQAVAPERSEILLAEPRENQEVLLDLLAFLRTHSFLSYPEDRVNPRIELTQTGLLSSDWRGRAAEFVKRLLVHLTNRLQEERSAFKVYTFASLQEAGVVTTEADFGLATTTISLLRLSGGSQIGRKPVHAVWNVPADAPDLRMAEDIGDLVNRVKRTIASRRKPVVARFTPADSLDPFTLHEPIGEGGYGIVHRATSRTAPHLERAVKILTPPFGAGHGRARFLREIEALSRLSHRAIVPYVAAGFMSSGDAYIAMTHIEGKTLNQARVHLTHDQIVEIIAELCDALHYAHGKGVIHRDVKPSNIIVRSSDMQPLLLDFGLAYVWDGLSDASLTTTMVGSLGYIPPEVQANPTLRRRTHDVYSLTVTLYEMLAGRRPNQQAYEGLTNIGQHLAGLDAIIRRGLDAEAERYGSCVALAVDLRRWIESRALPKRFQRSSLHERLRNILVSEKVEEEERRGKSKRLEHFLELEKATIQDNIEEAARAAFDEVSTLLTELRGTVYSVTDVAPVPHHVKPAPILAMVRTQGARDCAVLGRSTNPPVRVTRHDTSADIDESSVWVKLPSWELYEAHPHRMGSPERVHGAVWLVVTDYEDETATCRLEARGRSMNRLDDSEVRLDGITSVRDYWVRALARSLRIDL